MQRQPGKRACRHFRIFKLTVRLEILLVRQLFGGQHTSAFLPNGILHSGIDNTGPYSQYRHPGFFGCQYPTEMVQRCFGRTISAGVFDADGGRTTTDIDDPAAFFAQLVDGGPDQIKRSFFILIYPQGRQHTEHLFSPTHVSKIPPSKRIAWPLLTFGTMVFCL